MALPFAELLAFLEIDAKRLLGKMMLAATDCLRPHGHRSRFCSRHTLRVFNGERQVCLRPGIIIGMCNYSLSVEVVVSRET